MNFFILEDKLNGGERDNSPNTNTISQSQNSNLGWKISLQNLLKVNLAGASFDADYVHQDVFCSFASPHQTPPTNGTC